MERAYRDPFRMWENTWVDIVVATLIPVRLARRARRRLPHRPHLRYTPLVENRSSPRLAVRS